MADESEATKLLNEMIDSEMPTGWSTTLYCGAREDRYLVLEVPAQGVGIVRTSLSMSDATGLAWRLLTLASATVEFSLIVKMVEAYNKQCHQGDDTDGQ